MKRQALIAFCLMSGVVALAAEEAPPAELLNNLDFFQNMDMVEDQQFLAHAGEEPATVDQSTSTLQNKNGDSHEKID